MKRDNTVAHGHRNSMKDLAKGRFFENAIFPQLHLEKASGQVPRELLLHRPPGHNRQEAGGHHQDWQCFVQLVVLGQLYLYCYTHMFRSLNTKEPDPRVTLTDMPSGPLRFKL